MCASICSLYSTHQAQTCYCSCRFLDACLCMFTTLLRFHARVLFLSVLSMIEDQGDSVAALFASSPVYCTVYTVTKQSQIACRLAYVLYWYSGQHCIPPPLEVSHVLFFSVLSTSKRIRETQRQRCLPHLLCIAQYTQSQSRVGFLLHASV